MSKIHVIFVCPEGRKTVIEGGIMGLRDNDLRDAINKRILSSQEIGIRYKTVEVFHPVRGVRINPDTKGLNSIQLKDGRTLVFTPTFERSFEPIDWESIGHVSI